MIRLSKSLKKEFTLMSKSELACYFTTRKKPKIYFESVKEHVLKRKLRSLKKEFSFEKRIADWALRHKFLVGEDREFYMFNPIIKGWVDFGKDINWGKFENSEKSFKVNRLSFLYSLGLMYFLTGNVKYAKGGVNLLRDWYASNPFPTKIKSHTKGIAWRSLDTGIRIFPLLWLFFFTKSCPRLTTQEKFLMLEIIYLHGNALYKINMDSNRLIGNWQIHELSALAHLGILFPEFKQANLWRQLAYKKLEEQISRQFFTDGVHGEGSISYHIDVAQLYMDAILIAKINGFKIPKKLTNFTKKMVDFAMSSLRPDYTLPLINDSHLLDINTFILCAHQMFPKNAWPLPPYTPRKDFILRFPNNIKNSKKNKKIVSMKNGESKIFSNAGFAIMQGSSNQNSQYLFFDANPAWLPHTHASKLSFDLYSHGKSIIVDPGNCSYDHYHYSNWYKRTIAHNTIQINGIDQTTLVDTWKWDNVNSDIKKLFAVKDLETFLKNYGQPKVSIKQWISNNNFDFIEAEHEGYLKLVNPVIHNRKILYIKGKYWIIIDELKLFNENLTFANHYEFLLHFFPGKSKIEKETNIVSVDNGVTGILVIPLNKEKTDEVVLTQDKIIYNNKSTISPFLRYIKHTRNSNLFCTLLLPYKGKKPNVKIEQLYFDGFTHKSKKYGAKFNIDRESVYFIHNPYSKELINLDKKIGFQGKILYLKCKKDKNIEAFIALDSKRLAYQSKNYFYSKRENHKWKIF